MKGRLIGLGGGQVLYWLLLDITKEAAYFDLAWQTVLAIGFVYIVARGVNRILYVYDL